jgi:hypothetical protein
MIKKAVILILEETALISIQKKEVKNYGIYPW